MLRPEFFSRHGVFLTPRSVVGWLIAAAALAFCVYLFIEIDSRSHSVSDTLMNFVFNALIVAVVYSAVGYLFSKGK